MIEFGIFQYVIAGNRLILERYEVENCFRMTL